MPSASSQADGLWRLAWTCSAVVEDSLLWRLEQLGIYHTATVREPDREEVVTVLAWLDRQSWSEQQVRELAAPFAPAGGGLPGAHAPLLPWRADRESVVQKLEAALAAGSRWQRLAGAAGLATARMSSTILTSCPPWEGGDSFSQVAQGCTP